MMQQYISSLDAAIQAQKDISLKGASFGTIVYVPDNAVVDFHVQPWPPVLNRKDVSPRVLLVSTWVDNRFGFIGGGQKRNETAVEAMNREFFEEVGTEVLFAAEDHCFSSVVENKSISHIFAKATSDLGFFESLLVGFHRESSRAAYMDEVIAIAGYPVWLEGPDSIAEVCWNKSIHGLARHLCAQGGSFTPTMANTNVPRHHLLLVLFNLGVISRDLMHRVFMLSGFFNDKPRALPLPEFEEFIAMAESLCDAHDVPVATAVTASTTATVVAAAQNGGAGGDATGRDIAADGV